jgi:hypothetical protein
MTALNLAQITESNTTLNTVSLSSFEKRVKMLKSDIQEIVNNGLCGEFNNIEFSSKMSELSYFVENTYVLSDEDYKEFANSLCAEFGSFLNSQLS